MNIVIAPIKTTILERVYLKVTLTVSKGRRDTLQSCWRCCHRRLHLAIDWDIEDSEVFLPLAMLGMSNSFLFIEGFRGACSPIR